MNRVFFSSCQSDAGGLSVGSISRQHDIDVCQCGANDPVGNRLLDGNAGTKVPTEVSDDMDRHIADMAAKAVQARHDGDAHGAAIYIRRMVKAIRLQIDAARHLDEGADYFQAQGEAARLGAQEGSDA